MGSLLTCSLKAMAEAIHQKRIKEFKRVSDLVSKTVNLSIETPKRAPKKSLLPTPPASLLPPSEKSTISTITDIVMRDTATEESEITSDLLRRKQARHHPDLHLRRPSRPSALRAVQDGDLRV
jgi:hypothetical protein